MATKNVFQLSALSQNDPGAADGNNLYCEITSISNGTLQSGSFPIDEEVKLPIPPGGGNPAPATPTWFLQTSGQDDAVFNLIISGTKGSGYPTATITVKESDVKNWAAIPFDNRENQIYQKGEYGIFGFAQEGPNGLIYTITAGVLNPRKYGNTVEA